MRTLSIVLPTIPLTDRLCMGQSSECFHIQTLAAQGSVKPLIGSVLPGACRINVPAGNPRLLEPPNQGLGDKFRAVIATDEGWCSIMAEQSQKRLGHHGGVHTPSHLQCQDRSGVFILHGEDFALAAVVCGVQDQILRPHMVGI